jgi:hypothetical protein
VGLGLPILELVALLRLGPVAWERNDWVPSPPPARASAVGSLDPRALAALIRALGIAEEKLASPQCREIFQDFRDGVGRPLERTLLETGREPEGLLRGLEFADGSASLACRNRPTLAWTHPGGRTIYLCSMEFADAARSNPRFAANLLIHEGLHSLGLGENPPSSTAITEHVARKCGY